MYGKSPIILEAGNVEIDITRRWAGREREGKIKMKRKKKVLLGYVKRGWCSAPG